MKRLCSPISTQKEIFDFQERHNIKDLEMAKKNSFFNNYTVDVFLFVTAIISFLVLQ